MDDFKVEYTAGGATQNAIRVAQWMCKVPHATTFLGCVGKDDFAKTLEASAHKEGVNVQYMHSDANPTGTCAVLVTPDSERSLVANIGAANDFEPTHLAKPEIAALVEKAQFVYISSFFITASQESVQQVAKLAAEKNKVFALNLAAPFLMQFFADNMNANLPYCDYIFGNESEAVAFAEMMKWETTDIVEIATKISQLPGKVNTARPRIAVITQGADPTVIATDGNAVQFPVPAVPKEEIVDTNGAGDSFVGGFLSQLIQGKDVKECVRAGNWAASLVIRRSGATFPDVCEFA